MTAHTEGNHELAVFKEALGDMRDYLGYVEAGCQQIAFEFQSNKAPEALDKLVEIIEGLAFLFKLALAAENLLHVNMADIFVTEDLSADTVLEKLNALPSAICEAAEGKDYSLAGDLVEYDLTELIVYTQKLLLKLEEILRESQVG